VRTAHSFCRICAKTCGVVLEIDEADRIVSVRGDRENPVTQGYACRKGNASGEMHRREDRILRPLKRMADGSFAAIGLEEALDEIAEKVRSLAAEFGPHAVAGFLGTTGYFNVPGSEMLIAWLDALGSRSFFSSHTIDSSAKAVTRFRLGGWHAGRQPWETADVWMLLGNNHLVSLSTQGGMPSGNPAKQMKEAKARGMKLIVVDPRRTETARHATLFLQPRPGEDAAVLAGMLRIILSEGLADVDFCDRHVDGLGALREAVAPFTDEYVARRSGVAAHLIREAAHLFGGAGKRGCAGGATGVNMSPHSNLVDHLIETLNVVCGRYRRAGETIANAGGALSPRMPRYAEVLPPTRPWEDGYRSRIRGYGKIPGLAPGGEVPAGILADEILEPGEGQIRCLFVEGGNPAVAIPDQLRVAEAFRALDLIVTVEPFMSATARLAHYVLPPKLMYERPEIPWRWGEDVRIPIPFTQYSPAVVAPPEGAELCDDWEVYWGLAKRLGVPIELRGVALDLVLPPSTDELLGLLLRDAQVPFEEVVKHPRGKHHPLAPLVVQPARADATTRFEVMPQDVREDLAEYWRLPEETGFTHRLAVRRVRHVMNSLDPSVPEAERCGRYNPAFMHPNDLRDLGLKDGDHVEIASDYASITGIVEADEHLLPGVVSMSHCFGALPGEDDDPLRGANTGRLTDHRRHVQRINAMPTMSGLPVKVLAADRRRPAPSAGTRRAPANGSASDTPPRAPALESAGSAA
jgi:anaerobic selenocysteine-containing dehydrogenase